MPVTENHTPENVNPISFKLTQQPRAQVGTSDHPSDNLNTQSQLETAEHIYEEIDDSYRTKLQLQGSNYDVLVGDSRPANWNRNLQSLHEHLAEKEQESHGLNHTDNVNYKGPKHIGNDGLPEILPHTPAENQGKNAYDIPLRPLIFLSDCEVGYPSRRKSL